MKVKRDNKKVIIYFLVFQKTYELNEFEIVSAHKIEITHAENKNKS